MTVKSIDQAAWSRLSPWLDALLELTAPQREAQLAALRRTDSGLADDLTALLQRLPPLEAAGFLAAPALPPPAGLAGQTVGAYRLLREIGQGGMGSVWLAQRADGRYEAQVAIKFMHGSWLGRGAAERFQREGQMLARLDHLHIARLLDAGLTPDNGTAAGRPYLVMEYVDGLAIDQWCEVHALDLVARVRLVLAVLAAVAHAHSRLILHRDLKPSNILVAADGAPKLLDFGVGKLLADAEAGQAQASPEATQFTQAAFTVRYAAPEQVQGQDVTTASDVYALGVLLYGLLGGGHPTESAEGTRLAQMQAVVQTVPVRLSDAARRRRSGATGARQARALRGDLDTILARALKKDPAERYANAAALADDLRRWLDHEPVRARPDSAGYRVGRFVRRHLRVVLAAGTAGALALAGGAALALWQAHQARAERAQAVALVEFMLGDLQQKLSQLGRTDLLQSVGERALAYYANENLASLDAPALARRARALRLIGESARQRLDMAQARAAFDQAADTTGRLLALAPDDMQRLQEHADSLERMVELVERTLDSDAMLALCRQISALRWRVAALAPQDPGLRLQAWMGEQWPASVLVVDGPAQDGLALLARVQAGLQALPPDLVGLPRARAINLALVGQGLFAAGRYAEAADPLRAFLALQPARHEAVPDVRERVENLTVTRTLVQLLLDQGQLGPATALATQAVARAEQDASQSTDNFLLAESVIHNRTLLAEALWLGGAQQPAREQLAVIDASLARLGDVAADNTEWHLRTLGTVLALRARMQPQSPHPSTPAFLAALQAHAGQVAALDAQGRQLHGRALQATLAVGLAHGDALLAQAQPAAARLRWQAVADRALPAATDGSHPAMQQLALALLHLGQPQQARPWVERLQASEWRHPDLINLVQRLALAEGAPAAVAAVKPRAANP